MSRDTSSLGEFSDLNLQCVPELELHLWATQRASINKWTLQNFGIIYLTEFNTICEICRGSLICLLVLKSCLIIVTWEVTKTVCVFCLEFQAIFYYELPEKEDIFLYCCLFGSFRLSWPSTALVPLFPFCPFSNYWSLRCLCLLKLANGVTSKNDFAELLVATVVNDPLLESLLSVCSVDIVFLVHVTCVCTF